ncbi:MAG TPA: hypothetical protein VF704_09075 [Allosphingosinicella sp.]|jgi:hypothetical protein
MNKAKLSAALIGAAFLTARAADSAQSQTALPNPILYMTGSEIYETGGRVWVRHRYDVFNKDAYPAALFTAAPNLPPCGNNSNSSRTWVDFFDARTNRRLYGFCALGSPQNLGSLWFSTEEGVIPPSYVYIVMTDRQTNIQYRSNPADTTL